MSSTKKQKAHKSTGSHSKLQHASVIVGEIVDQQIDARTTQCKYPNATRKWMKKLRSNILRKISEQSRTLFNDDEQKIAQAKEEINALIERIQAQQDHIKEILESEGKTSARALQDRPASRRTSYTPGQFEDHAGNIQDQYRKLSKVLPALRDEAETRANGLATTINTVKGQVQPMLAELQARRQARAAQQSAGGRLEGASGSAGSGSGSGSGSGKRGAPRATTGAAAVMAAAPAAALQRHLGRK